MASGYCTGIGGENKATVDVMSRPSYEGLLLNFSAFAILHCNAKHGRGLSTWEEGKSLVDVMGESLPKQRRMKGAEVSGKFLGNRQFTGLICSALELNH